MLGAEAGNEAADAEVELHVPDPRARGKLCSSPSRQYQLYFFNIPSHQLIDWCLQSWLPPWTSPIKLHKGIRVLLPVRSSSNISPSTLSSPFFKIIES